MNPDTAPPADTARPRLSERHNAMLRAMGVGTWWDAPPPAAAPVRAQPTQPKPPKLAAPPVAAPDAPVAPAALIPAAPQLTPAPAPKRDMGAGDVGLDALASAIRECQACDLGRQRRQAVPGVGGAAPHWLIVGDAPDEEEDREGLPLVGPAGRLLDRMLAAMQLERGPQVYLAPAIKCRPPQSRNPSAQEVAQCSPHLLHQIQLLRPRLVLTMGRLAAHTVLGLGAAVPADTLAHTPLGKLRGQVHWAQLGALRLPVVATYHPAYLLRHPADKGKAWADLCLALDTFAGLSEALPQP